MIMRDGYAPPTPLTGPYPFSRSRALADLPKRPAAQTRVYLRPDGAAVVVPRGRRLGLLDALRSGYQAVYLVDEDSHTTDLDIDLPSAEPGVRFEARVRVLWWVHEVERAVQSQVGDVRDTLTPFLESYLTRGTREYTSAELDPAEDRVRRDLTGDLPLEVGLTVRVLTVTLRVDHDVIPAGDSELAELRRELLKEQARGQLAELRARNDVNAWRIRLGFYREVIDGGLPAMLALRLMVDPAAAGDLAGKALPPTDGWTGPDAVGGRRPPGLKAVPDEET